MQIHEVQELHGRIALLEEETSKVKRALLEAMCDRKRLIDEVYHYFQNIDSCCLQIRDQFPGKSSSVASVTARSSEVILLNHIAYLPQLTFHCESNEIQLTVTIPREGNSLILGV